MKKTIFLASQNKNKLKEILDIALRLKCSWNFEVVPQSFVAIENGETLFDNALIKAKAAFNIIKQYYSKNFFILADDTGLFVEALGQRPGVFSARYANSQQEKITKLLDEMNDITNRNAKFVSVMVLLNSDGNFIFEAKGVLQGKVLQSPLGSNGFGYDPIFFVEEFGKTFAQMSEHEKNATSHRAKALFKVIDFIEKFQ